MVSKVKQFSSDQDICFEALKGDISIDPLHPNEGGKRLGRAFHSFWWDEVARSSSGSAATVTLTLPNYSLSSSTAPHLLLGAAAEIQIQKKANLNWRQKAMNCDIRIASKAVGSPSLCLCSPAIWNEGTPPSQALPCLLQFLITPRSHLQVSRKSIKHFLKKSLSLKI